MALSGRIDLLGLREDGLFIVELKRTKRADLSARVQACMYRDLMFDLSRVEGPQWKHH